jgi:hypothetical protein
MIWPKLGLCYIGPKFTTKGEVLKTCLDRASFCNTHPRLLGWQPCKLWHSIPWRRISIEGNSRHSSLWHRYRLLLLWRLEWLLRPLGNSLIPHHSLLLPLHQPMVMVTEHPAGAQRGVAGRLVHCRSLGAKASHFLCCYTIKPKSPSSTTPLSPPTYPNTPDPHAAASHTH